MQAQYGYYICELQMDHVDFLLCHLINWLMMSLTGIHLETVTHGLIPPYLLYILKGQDKPREKTLLVKCMVVKGVGTELQDEKTIRYSPRFSAAVKTSQPFPAFSSRLLLSGRQLLSHFTAKLTKSELSFAFVSEVLHAGFLYFFSRHGLCFQNFLFKLL